LHIVNIKEVWSCLQEMGMFYNEMIIQRNFIETTCVKKKRWIE
jgi:hypothetical protein